VDVVAPRERVGAHYMNLSATENISDQRISRPVAYPLSVYASTFIAVIKAR
jgi:hypothetical protein